MSLINPDLSGIVDGSVGDAADWTTPMNTIIDVINGGLTTDNFTAAGTNLSTIASSVAWGTWSITWDGVTVGNGTLTTAYVKVGRWVEFDWKLVFGTTTQVTAASDVLFSLPVTSAALTGAAGTMSIGPADLEDSGNGVYGAFVKLYDTGNGIIKRFAVSGSNIRTDLGIATTVPFTWGTDDSIHVHGSYQAAS